MAFKYAKADSVLSVKAQKRGDREARAIGRQGILSHHAAMLRRYCLQILMEQLPGRRCDKVRWIGSVVGRSQRTVFSWVSYGSVTCNIDEFRLRLLEHEIALLKGVTFDALCGLLGAKYMEWRGAYGERYRYDGLESVEVASSEDYWLNRDRMRKDAQRRLSELRKG